MNTLLIILQLYFPLYSAFVNHQFEADSYKDRFIRSQNDDKICQAVSVPEEELNQINDLSEQLQTFMRNDFRAQHQQLREVLLSKGFGEKEASKLWVQETLGSFTLRHQINLYKDMKLMFSKFEELLELRNKSGLNTRTKRQMHKKRKKFKIVYNGSSNRLEIIDKHKAVVRPPVPNNIHGSKARMMGRTALDDWKLYLMPHFYFASAPIYKPRPADCSDVLAAGNKQSGVYKIYPFRCLCSDHVYAYCDMTTDGGGWSVFLTKYNNHLKQENFTRNWKEYRNGFGNPSSEYWMGNEALHYMTMDRKYTLMLEEQTSEGGNTYGKWETFHVESEKNQYKVTATNFNPKSLASDTLSRVNGQVFSTYDNDSSQKKCTDTHRVGFWYTECTNTIFPTGDVSSGIVPPNNQQYPALVQLKIRPKSCDEPVAMASLNNHNCPYYL